MKVQRMSIVGLIFTITSLFAVESNFDGFTLANYLKYAEHNSPSLLKQKKIIEMGENIIKYSTKLPDPKLTGGVFITPVETRVGPQRSKVGLSQMIPWPGKLSLKKKIEISNLNIEKEKYRELRAKLFSNIISSYSDLYYLKKAIDINQENLLLFEKIRSNLESKYRVAVAKQTALIKIEIEEEIIADNIENLRLNLNSQKSHFAALLNANSGDIRSLPDSLPDFKLALEEGMLKVNPIIKIEDLKIDKSEQILSLAKNNFAPDMSIMTDYIFTDKSPSSMVTDNENGKDPWIVGLGITIPFWINKNKKNIVAKKLLIESAKSSKKDKTNNIESTLDKFINSYKDSDRKIRFYQNILIPKAERIVELTQTDYKNGKASLLDFIDTERMLLKLKLTLAKKESDKAKYFSKIDMLFGAKFISEIIK